jgi:hypothetical protein
VKESALQANRRCRRLHPKTYRGTCQGQATADEITGARGIEAYSDSTKVCDENLRRIILLHKHRLNIVQRMTTLDTLMNHQWKESIKHFGELDAA